MQHIIESAVKITVHVTGDAYWGERRKIFRPYRSGRCSGGIFTVEGFIRLPPIPDSL